MAKRKNNKTWQDEEPAFDNPFAVLGKSLGSEERAKPQDASVPPQVLEVPVTVSLRRVRKGYGGKEVTILSKMQLDESSLKAFAKQLRKELGTGSRIEGEEIVIQGDLRERLRSHLDKLGIKTKG